MIRILRIGTWIDACALRLLLALVPTVAVAQDPIPQLDLDDPAKVVVLRLHFSNLNLADVEGADVSYGIPPAQIGAPPMLSVELRDLEGTLLEEFDAWHPLKAYEEAVDGSDSGIILPEGSGSLILPLTPNLAAITVMNQESGLVLAEVDLIPPIHSFCRENTLEPECENPANRAPVCDADGPYRAECAGATTLVPVDGSGSYDLDGDPLTYLWNPEGGISQAGPTPTLEITAVGDTYVNLTIQDDWMGVDDCETVITVEDTVAPDLTAPPDVSAECTSPEGTSVVLGSPSVIEVCDAEPGVTNDAPPLFPLGTTTVTWTATDEESNFDTDTQAVTIVDTLSAVIMCNSPPTILPPDAPIAFKATADDQCQGPIVPQVVSYDCFAFTKKGKRIDKTESCVVSFAGDTLTIHDSGGVDDTIEWVVAADDGNGNTTTQVCSVCVANPG